MNERERCHSTAKIQTMTMRRCAIVGKGFAFRRMTKADVAAAEHVDGRGTANRHLGHFRILPPFWQAEPSAGSMAPQEMPAESDPITSHLIDYQAVYQLAAR
jgi:hypothetical protein